MERVVFSLLLARESLALTPAFFGDLRLPVSRNLRSVNAIVSFSMHCQNSLVYSLKEYDERSPRCLQIKSVRV